MSDEHLARCTYVAPNVSELARLTGRDLDRKDASDADVDAACHVLIARGATKVLATLGSRGCRLVSKDGVVVGEACTSIKASTRRPRATRSERPSPSPWRKDLMREQLYATRPRPAPPRSRRKARSPLYLLERSATLSYLHSRTCPVVAASASGGE